MKFSSLKRNLLISCVAFLFAVTGALAQTGTSSLHGVVTDKTGAAIVGAKVTLTNAALGLSRNSNTGSAGDYEFLALPPGTYVLTVEVASFRKFERTNLQLLVGTPATSNVTMELGTAIETVEVSAQTATLNTTDASLGNAFDSNQITHLPLEGRNLVDLLSLQPGTTREGYVTGARADQSNVTLDGVDINNAQTGNAAIPQSTNNLVIGGLDTDRGDITSGPVLRLNSEAVEEFRVTTANGGANQGRSAGAQIK